MSHRIKVLFIMPSAICGGAEKVMVSLIRDISRVHFSPALILIDNNGSLLSDIPRDIIFDTLNNNRLSRSLPSLLKAIRSLRPDIIITILYHLNIAVLMLRPLLPKRTRIIIRESNFPSILLPRERSPKLFGLLIRIFYRTADRVVCLCEDMKRDLINNFSTPKDKIVNIPNPIDLKKIEQLAKNHECFFDKSKFNFIAVGSLTHQKGFDLLIRAMALVARQSTNIHLTIIGAGNLRTELQNLVASLHLEKAISLAGFMSNPYSHFYHADRFVLSSHYEGLPNVVLESLALGTPVIALDNPGCLRDIIINRDQGVLVHPCTEENLAREMINACCQNPLFTKKSLLPRQFLIDHVVKKYEELFQST